MRGLGLIVDQNALHDIIQEVDFDCSDEIDFREFQELMGRYQKSTMAQFEETWDLFDLDGDGEVVCRDPMGQGQGQGGLEMVAVSCLVLFHG